MDIPNKPSENDIIQIYPHKSKLTSGKRHGWRRVAANNEIISSGEGFISKGNAKRGAKRANPDYDKLKVMGV